MAADRQGEMTGGSHYDTLGLPPDATPVEIREAFIRLAAAYDPGAGASSMARREAGQAVAAMKAAYETLADPRRRAEYDWRLGIDDLQPLDWGGAMPEPHPVEVPGAARPPTPRGWLSALRRRG